MIKFWTAMISLLSLHSISDSNPESGEDQKRESSDSISIIHSADGSPDVATSNEVKDVTMEGPSQQPTEDLNDLTEEKKVDR